MQLNIIGPVCKETSYGSSLSNLVCALDSLGVETSLWNIGTVSFEPHQQDILIHALNRGKLGFSASSPCIRVYHAFAQDLFCGSPRIAFPIFELNKFTILEKHHLKQVDKIFVPSTWGAQTCLLNGLSSQIVPLGIDGSIFTPKLNPGKTTQFLHIGKFEIRKSSADIVDCFNQAFNIEDDVSLSLLWYNRFQQEDQKSWDDFALQSPLGSKINIVQPLSSCFDVAKLIQEHDAVISLSKAEGFNLPILEGLSCGKQVIVTNCTAQKDFCNNDSAFLIEMNDIEVAWDGKFFTSEGFDGEPGCWYSVEQLQKEQFVNFLQIIHKKKQGGNLQLNESGIEMAKSFSWENSAKKLLECLEHSI